MGSDLPYRANLVMSEDMDCDKWGKVLLASYELKSRVLLNILQYTQLHNEELSRTECQWCPRQETQSRSS